MNNSKFCEYTKGYKYILEKQFIVYTGINFAIGDEHVTQYNNGWLVINKGFG